MLGDFPRTITAAGVIAARLGGALRYWPKDGGSSSVVGLSRAECADLVNNKIPFATIYEGGAATWMAGGGSAGVQAGNWLRQQFINAGHTPRCVYLAADSNTLSSVAINACLDGAASILGRDKVGLYAYLPQLEAAHAGGHASFYWLTGRYVAPGAYPWINVYQCQGSQPSQYPTTVSVSGQTGDGDIPFTPDWGQQTGAVDDMALTDSLGPYGGIDTSGNAVPAGAALADMYVAISNGKGHVPGDKTLFERLADIDAANAANAAALAAIAGAQSTDQTALLAAIQGAANYLTPEQVAAQAQQIATSLQATVPAAVWAEFVTHVAGNAPATS